MDIISLYANKIDIFLLILVRMTGIFVVAPVFGARNFPTYMKIGLAFASAIIVTSVINPVNLSYFDSMIAYGILVFRELVVGIIIGFVAYLIFTAIFMAGEIIDMQMGFGVVNTIDPMSNVQVPMTGNFYYIFTILIFLLADGHHVLLSALFKSYDILPIGSVVFNNSLIDVMISLVTDMFIIGFKIAAPIVLAILVTDIGLGILTKTIPQLNVFVVGIPIKIFIGLLIITVTIPAFVGIIGVLKDGMNNDIFMVVKEMVPK